MEMRSWKGADASSLSTTPTAKNVKRPLLFFGLKAPTKLRTSPVKIYKELSLSSYLFSEFGSDEISPPNDNVTFSTAWIKNLSESRGSFLSSLGCGLNNLDAFYFSAHPNRIPGSVLQLAGASYLLNGILSIEVPPITTTANGKLIPLRDSDYFR